MNKFGKFAFTLGILLGLLTSVTTTVQAKTTWHKGTPTALRGYWIYGERKPKNTGLGFDEHFHITKNQFQWAIPGMTGITINKPYYHKSGNYYYIKGYVKKGGMNKAGTAHFKFHKTGSKTLWKLPKQKGDHPYKKIAHLRAWYKK